MGEVKEFPFSVECPVDIPGDVGSVVSGSVLSNPGRRTEQVEVEELIQARIQASRKLKASVLLIIISEVTSHGVEAKKRRIQCSERRQRFSY